jgi:hypothetical protein
MIVEGDLVQFKLERWFFHDNRTLYLFQRAFKLMIEGAFILNTNFVGLIW